MTKLECLKSAKYKLENGLVVYDWIFTISCNCGIVLTELLAAGTTIYDAGFRDTLFYSGKGIFSGRAYCMTTNKPLPLLFQLAKDAGFTYQELHELEYLSNPKIAEILGFNLDFNTGYMFAKARKDGNSAYNIKENLIAYLREWIKILEAEKTKPATITYKVERVVKVDAEILDMEKVYN